MKRSAAITIFGLALLALSVCAQDAPPPVEPQFGCVDVFIDSAAAPLAAYQLELTDELGQIKIVGIEGGEHAAFSEPPYYDPEAIGHGKVILAAFSTSKELSKGHTRVARIHVMVPGPDRARFASKLILAATLGGARIDATLSLSPQGETK